jgi:phage baseplate assembly protein W
MARRTATYSDIDMELTRQTDGDITRDTETDAIINSLNNIVSTLQGSRRMLPEFAHNVWKLLFEPIDRFTANSLASAIVDGIKEWEDRVDITTVNITPNYGQNLYQLHIIFNIKPFTDEQNQKEIQFVLYSQ